MQYVGYSTTLDTHCFGDLLEFLMDTGYLRQFRGQIFDSISLSGDKAVVNFLINY